MPKKDKTSVEYGSGMPDSHCGICRFYHDGECEKVQGFIRPSCWCKLFKRRPANE